MVMMVERSLPVVEMREQEDVVEYRGQKLTVPKSEWSERQGVNGIPFSVGRQQLEYNRNLTPYKARGISSDVGIYWRLGSSMPMVRDALMGMTAAITAAPWRLELGELPTYWQGNPAAEAARKRQYEFCSYVWSKWTATGADYAWPQWLADVLRFSFVCGFYCGEKTADLAPIKVDGKMRRLLCPDLPCAIMPWTVDEWVFKDNPDTGMLALVQRTYSQSDSFGGSGAGEVVIPWERVCHVPLLPASPGDLEGSSALRPAQVLLKAKQKTIQLQTLGAEVNALGLLSIKPDPQNPFNPEAEADVRAQLDGRTAEQVAYIIWPPGDHKVEYIRPSDTVPDLSKQIETLDQQIGKALGNVHRLMSLQGTGSFAARKDASGEARDAMDFWADIPARAAERILRQFIELNFPLDAALGMVFTPNVNHAAVEEMDNEARMRTLTGYTSAGLLTPTPDIQAQILQENDLTTTVADGES